MLIVTQYFWPESFLINDVAADLSDINCDVTVLTGQPNYPDGDIFPGFSALGLGRGSAICSYSIFRVPVAPRGLGGGRRILNYASFILSAGLFAPFLLRGKRFDVVFVYAVSPILQALPAILLGRIKNAALVVWVQDLWPDALRSTGFVKHEGVLRCVGQVTRYIYRSCDLILAQSNGFVKKIQQLGGESVLVKVHHNPGNHVTVGGDEPIDVPQLPAGFNIVFAGNLGAAQSLETILNAAEILGVSACAFTLVGSGSRSEWLGNEITRRGIANVHLAGRFPASIMPAILKQASALLVTLARSESLALTIPSKIPAYLAAGKPILASLDGEAAEVIVNSGAGHAVPAEDHVALADAIRKLIDTSERARIDMGSAGQAYFQKHFAPKNLAADLKRHLQWAVRRRKASVDTGPTDDGDNA